MNIVPVLINGVWAGLLSGACAVLFSAPPQFLFAGACGGFLARVCRDVLMQMGATQGLATFAAAAAVILFMTAVFQIRRPGVSPVLSVSSLIPLGAAKAFFVAIITLLKVSAISGDDQAAASVEVLSNLSIVVRTTLAIAVGASIGAMIAATVMPRLRQIE